MVLLCDLAGLARVRFQIVFVVKNPYSSAITKVKA
jgi:hypothetical protein